METVLQSKTKTVIISPAHPFVMIGEKINPSGRKKLGAEMGAGDFSRVKKDAVAQVEAGAQMLDVNAGYPMGDEPTMLVAAIKTVQSVTDVPISIDSSVVEALQAALAVYEGKPLINSVTGEDERLEKILPLVKKYNAAVIGMANDETGISMDPEFRLGIARKIVQRAADYGIAAENIIIDPLALTIAADSSAVKITLQTMRLIQDQLGVNMSVGAGNTSFGLPERPFLTATFISMARVDGLTCAITDALNDTIRQSIRAGDVMLGQDEYAASWIAEFRAKQKTGQP
ncbi:MAG: dihydropteroate synthase [Chloroflexi bacterium]|nr:dihydropteroate synthase [Chloroflexota bacterium]